MPALPAEVRINVNTPFPALVNGQNGIALGKQNGIWNVALNYPSLALTTAADASAVQVAIYEPATGIYYRVALSQITATPIIAQRRVTASPIVVQAGDVMLNCDIATGSPSCSLPLSASRAGQRVIFKDATGQFGVHPLTLTPSGGQTIDGLASLTLSTNFQWVELTPFNDSVGSGWMITG